MDNQQGTATSTFRGFRSPNTTPIPDEVFDELLSVLSGAELKVLLYICRRTFGFKKESDTISLNQIAEGITTRDGRVLDQGTGLSKRHVQRALKSLEEKRIVEVSRQIGEDGVNEINVYSLHFLEGVGTKCPYGRDKKYPGVGTPVSTTINSIQETEYKTVNGDQSIFKKLPNLDQPQAKTAYIAKVILDQLGDTQSERFYTLVAAKIPEPIIRQALAEVKADGADEPPKLFTHKMKLYVLGNSKKQIGALPR
jgi:phage replication O-like protein O